MLCPRRDCGPNQEDKMKHKAFEFSLVVLALLLLAAPLTAQGVPTGKIAGRVVRFSRR